MLTVKRILSGVCCALLAINLVACEQQGPAERAGEKVDEAVEETKETMEEVGEDMQEAAEETGEKVEEMGEKMQKR